MSAHIIASQSMFSTYICCLLFPLTNSWPLSLSVSLAFLPPLLLWLSSDPSLAGRERQGGGGRGAGRENGRLSLHGAPLTSQRYPGESEPQGCFCYTSCLCLSMAGCVLTLQEACDPWCNATSSFDCVLVKKTFKHSGIDLWLLMIWRGVLPSAPECFGGRVNTLHVYPPPIKADCLLILLSNLVSFFCCLAAAYYPATQQYPTSVSATPVMMNPTQQQPAPPPQQAPPQQTGPAKPRERKQVGGNDICCFHSDPFVCDLPAVSLQIRIRDPNQGGRDITEEIMSGGRTTSTPTPPQVCWWLHAFIMTWA